MLKLITTQARLENEHKIWFNDQQNDLFVWLDQTGIPIGFQFCYDKARDEHSLYWHQDKGFHHCRVDNGENKLGHYKMSPIMTAKSCFKTNQIAEIFDSTSQQLDAELRKFIEIKIRCFIDQH